MLEFPNCCLCGAEESSIEAVVKDWVHETTSTPAYYVRCDFCGHVFQSPRLNIQHGHLMYSNDNVLMFHESLSMLLRCKLWIQWRRVKDLVALVPEDGKIVEVGAGDGILLIAIRAKRPDLTLVAIDIVFSPQVKSHLRDSGVDVVEGAIDEATTFEQHFMGSIDLIIMNQAIEHLWKPVVVLQSLYHALKVGGVILISTPDFDGYDRKIWKQYWGGWYAPRHLNLFTRDEIVTTMTSLNFRILRIRSLVAPVIWCHSVGGFLSHIFKRKTVVRPFLRSSPALLIIFSLIDVFAILLKQRTSNVEYLVRK